eukprot:2523465-Pyramimonas_sp.AAC.1
MVSRKKKEEEEEEEGRGFPTVSLPRGTTAGPARGPIGRFKGRRGGAAELRQIRVLVREVHGQKGR